MTRARVDRAYLGSLGRCVRDATCATFGVRNRLLLLFPTGARGAPRGAGSLGRERFLLAKKTVRKRPSQTQRDEPEFARSFDVWRVTRRDTLLGACHDRIVSSLRTFAVPMCETYGRLVHCSIDVIKENLTSLGGCAKKPFLTATASLASASAAVLCSRKTCSMVEPSTFQVPIATQSYCIVLSDSCVHRLRFSGPGGRHTS